MARGAGRQAESCLAMTSGHASALSARTSAEQFDNSKMRA
jgi:hypothetical protein